MIAITSQGKLVEHNSQRFRFTLQYAHNVEANYIAGTFPHAVERRLTIQSR
jgi:hypothetical protein